MKEHHQFSISLEKDKIQGCSIDELKHLFALDFHQELSTYNKLRSKNFHIKNKIKSMFQAFNLYGDVVRFFLDKQSSQLKLTSQLVINDLNNQIEEIKLFKKSIDQIMLASQQDQNIDEIKVVKEDPTSNESIISLLIEQTRAVNNIRKLLGIDNTFYHEMLENLITKFNEFSKKLEKIITKSPELGQESLGQVKSDERIFQELNKFLQNFNNKLKEPEKKFDLTSIQPCTDFTDFSELIKKNLEKSLEEGFRTYNKLGDKNSSVYSQILELISIIRTNCNIANVFLEDISELKLFDSSNLSQIKAKISELTAICSQDFSNHEQDIKADLSQPKPSISITEILQEKKRIDSFRIQRAELNTKYQEYLNEILDLNYEFSRISFSLFMVVSSDKSRDHTLTNADKKFEILKTNLKNILEKFKKTRSFDRPSFCTSQANADTLAQSNSLSGEIKRLN